MVLYLLESDAALNTFENGGVGGKLLSEIRPANAETIRALAQVVSYYADQAGIPKNVQRGISPNTSSEKAMAYTNQTGIFVSAKNGISEKLNDYNSMVSSLKHEDLHRRAGDPYKRGEYKYTEHVAIYEQQISDEKTFKPTSQSYKQGIAANYTSYLIGALENYEIDVNGFYEKVDAMNKKLKPYNVWISGERLSSGEILMEVNRKDTKGIIYKTDLITPRSNPH